MNAHRAVITEAQHFNIIAKRQAGELGSFAKPGEEQAKACKRLQAD